MPEFKCNAKSTDAMALCGIFSMAMLIVSSLACCSSGSDSEVSYGGVREEVVRDIYNVPTVVYIKGGKLS